MTEATSGTERDYLLAAASMLAYEDQNGIALSRFKTEFGDNWVSSFLGFHKGLGVGSNLAYRTFMNLESHEFIIAFRGSDDLDDWLSNNLRVGAASPAWPGFANMGINIHRGFLEGWVYGRQSIFAELNTPSAKFIVDRIPWNIYVAGHSLGGAIAQLCFSDFLGQLATTGIIPDYPGALLRVRELYIGTFAAPVVGDQAFADTVARHAATLNNAKATIVGGGIYEVKNEIVGINWANAVLGRLGCVPPPVSIGSNYVPLHYAQSVPGAHDATTDPLFVKQFNLGHAALTYVRLFDELRRSNAPPGAPPPHLHLARLHIVIRVLSASTSCMFNVYSLEKSSRVLLFNQLVDENANSADLVSNTLVSSTGQSGIDWPIGRQLLIEAKPRSPRPIWDVSLIDLAVFFDSKQVARLSMLRLDQANPTYVLQVT